MIGKIAAGGAAVALSAALLGCTVGSDIGGSGGTQGAWTSGFESGEVGLGYPMQLDGEAFERYGFWDETKEVGVASGSAEAEAGRPEAVLSVHEAMISDAGVGAPGSRIRKTSGFSLSSVEPMEVDGVPMARFEGFFFGYDAEGEPAESVFVAFTLADAGRDCWLFVYDNTPDQSVGLDRLTACALQIAESCEIAMG